MEDEVKAPGGGAADGQPAGEEAVKRAAKPKKKRKAADKKPGKNIILVESPTKVKTIKKFVKNRFEVLATKGHVMDLPKSRLGIDIENNFEPTYIVLRNKRKTLSELKKEIKKAPEVYLAADPDREGEAICWHMGEEIKRSAKQLGEKIFHRVTFNEITETAVLKALEQPREIDMNLVNAQQARRVLDRLVGYKISPLLWGAIRKGLSAGRVQSVALKLIVDRQREIDAFKPVEYWSVEARLETGKKEEFTAKLAERDGLKIDMKNEPDTQAIVEDLKKQAYSAAEVLKKERRRRALPPFITSTLQQDAAKKYRFTAQKTMIIAQQLYEGIELKGEGQVGLITYMRTDSLRVADEAQKEAAAYIREKIGPDYLPDAPNVYKSRKSAQDAHEAIRPSSAYRDPETIKDSLDGDQYRVYSLIWKRFVASQMGQAVFDDTRVRITAGPYLFLASGSIQKFDGFLKVYEEIKAVENGDQPENGDRDDGRDNRLPEIIQGEQLGLKELLPAQHFTQPPAAYTDATLVKTLEEKDIGRPSTYAPIISTLVARRYIDRDRNKFLPSELGFLVSDVLLKSFPGIINEEFTAKMEDNLDSIEEGKVEWRTLIKDFYGPFEELLKQAETHMGDLKKDIQGDLQEVCEKCGGKMIIKWGRFGKFMSCENYPECKNAKPLAGQQREEEKIDEKCPTCGAS